MKTILKFLMFILCIISSLNYQAVQAYQEESTCQLANTCQSLLSERVRKVTTWSKRKENKLNSFLQEWQLGMGQCYVEYDTLSIDQTNLFDNISVEGKPVNLEHHNH